MTTPLTLSARYALCRARAPLRALYAVLDEIQNVLIATPAPEVRRAKIAFWEAELAAATTGAARHPLARALPSGSVCAIALSAIEAARAEAALADRFPGDLFRTLLTGQGGRPLRLVAALEGAVAPEALGYAEQVGTAYALTARLQTIGLACRHRPWEIASLAAEASSRNHERGDPQAAMEVLRDWAANAYKVARRQTLTAPLLPRSTRVLAALGECLLVELSEEMRADPRRLLAGRILLPDPRMHWIALRALWGRRARLSP
ncbi:MAG: hypothetical protein ACYCTF_08500 [Acidiferrobacter sp.]